MRSVINVDNTKYRFLMTLQCKTVYRIIQSFFQEGLRISTHKDLHKTMQRVVSKLDKMALTVNKLKLLTLKKQSLKIVTSSKTNALTVL